MRVVSGKADVVAGPADEDFQGTPGNDVYTFAGAFGDDFVFEQGGFDTVVFPAHTADEVDVFASRDDLVLEIAGSRDRVRIIDFDRGKSHQIEMVTFADGDRIELPELVALFGRRETQFERHVAGNPNDVVTPTEPAVVVMGGSTDVDSALRWMIEKAGGGDFVVVRASGTPAYNPYIFDELGRGHPDFVGVDSCETLIVDSFAKANDPEITAIVAGAEAIWIAGGDQFDYVRHWRGSALVETINERARHVPVGGTSSGCNVLGQIYFTAEHDAIDSREALDDPFHPKLELARRDLFRFSPMASALTDSHLNNPDRMGRLVSFMARAIDDGWVDWRDAFAIGVEQRTAVAIDADGLARVFAFGEGFQQGGHAFFIRPMAPPERVEPGRSLDWFAERRALEVYRVPGTVDGEGTFDLERWDGAGGSWHDLWVDRGRLEPDLVVDWVEEN